MAIKLVILVVSALASTKIAVIMHALDRRNPLDHLEADLVLAAQAQRRAVSDLDQLSNQCA